MKLLMENWREYLEERQKCKNVTAYHGSPHKFDTFSIDHAKGPQALYFSNSLAGIRKFTPVTYTYEVELTLCGPGAKYPKEPSEADNYGYDTFRDSPGEPLQTVYKMLDAKNIKILNVEEEETTFDWF
tara:strand:+ start:147 stop:530 length:384 start_codon:yes stop_codon:yes gene_type:complete